MTLYFQIGGSLSLLGILFFALARKNEKSHWFTYSQLSQVSRVSLVFLFFLSCLPLNTSPLEPISSAQIWAGPSMRNFEVRNNSETPISFFNARPKKGHSLEKTYYFLSLLIGIGMLLALFHLTSSVLTLRKLVRHSQVLRVRKRFCLLTSDNISSPLSFVLGSYAYVVIPSSLVGNRNFFRLSLKHELEHLRRKDPQWAHLYVALKNIFFWNPFVQLFFSTQEHIQEFACDETLSGQEGFSLQAYGRCLLEVAKTMEARLSAREDLFLRSGTACGALARSPSLLKRRILFMMDSKTKPTWYTWPLATFLLVALTTTALAFQSSVQDRRISMEKAEELAARARTSSFPITVNEKVLKELNRFVGTPDGREYMRNALERLKGHEAMVKERLSAYHLPVELIALPIMESAYINSAPNQKPYYAAGIWQIIPETARNLGLVVTPKLDERMNVEKATDAASRYLAANYLWFQDWELTVLSYNAGEYKVLEGIKKTGSRNAWEIIEAGFEGDKNYLAKVTTAVILWRNPETLK